MTPHLQHFRFVGGTSFSDCSLKRKDAGDFVLLVRKDAVNAVEERKDAVLNDAFCTSVFTDVFAAQVEETGTLS